MFTLWQMSASFGNAFHTDTHSWDAVLQVALETAGNEREMAGTEEGKSKGIVSFSFIRSHTLTTIQHVCLVKKTLTILRHESFDLSTQLLYLIMSSCHVSRQCLFALCCEVKMRAIFKRFYYDITI